MAEYQDAVNILKNLSTKTYKGKKEYVDLLYGLTIALNKLADTYNEIGYGKLASSAKSLSNKMGHLRRKIEEGKITKLPEIKAEAKEAYTKLVTLAPQTAESGKEKAGIKDQSKVFSGFNKKRVKIKIAEDAVFALERAPLLLLFKNKITPVQTNFLKKLNATFYQGTNGVSLPAIPILVLNTSLVGENEYQKKIKAILKGLKRPDLAVFTNEAVKKNNYVAFPVFEPKLAEFLAVGIFDQCQSKELWIA